MLKLKVFLLLLALFSVPLYAQIYITRNGTIVFYSEAPLENIEATNRQVFSALNTETGELAFRILMRSFNFEKALMQQHFNDNFVESHIHPNANFQGMVENIESIDFQKDGLHEVRVGGVLTIKGVSNDVSEQGTLQIKGNTIEAKSTFIVKPEDYDISIPSRYVRNIAEEIEVRVNLSLNPR